MLVSPKVFLLLVIETIIGLVIKLLVLFNKISRWLLYLNHSGKWTSFAPSFWIEWILYQYLCLLVLSFLFFPSFLPSSRSLSSPRLVCYCYRPVGYSSCLVWLSLSPVSYTKLPNLGLKQGYRLAWKLYRSIRNTYRQAG